MLYGSYFFVADNIIKDSRNVYGVVDLVSEFGGLQAYIVLTFFFIVSNFNNVQLLTKQIRNMYFEEY